MYSYLSGDVLQRAGNFSLNSVNLVSYQGVDGTSQPYKLSITTLVTEINIYESIFNKTLSGNILVTDATNIIATLPLTGLERIEFKLNTPGINRSFDFTEETGHPMFIYKLDKRQGVTPRTQIYVLHFCSKELILNEQTKVSRAYTGLQSDMVVDMIRNSDYLDSKKDIYVEETLGNHKYVMPRIDPFGGSDILRKQSRSKRFYNAGYHLYETSLGFNYRSIESMLAITDNIARPSVAKFSPGPSNVREGGNYDVLKEMTVVSDYSIKTQFDTLKNLRNGVYSSKLLAHDLFNKTIKEYNYDYHTEFAKSHHTEHGPNGEKSDMKFLTPLSKIYKDKFISDTPESTIYLYTNTSNLHSLEGPPIQDYVQKRLSQHLGFETYNLEMTVPGFTGLSAGDVITFVAPRYASYDPKDPLDRDPYASGRYLVSTVRHVISQIANKHTMHLQCLKDSVNIPYVAETVDTFTDREKSDNGVIDQYTLDDRLLNGLNSGNELFK